MNRFALPVGFGVAGLAVGFSLGWGLKPKQAAEAKSPDPEVHQPSGNLTKENAQKLIEASYADPDAPGMNCMVEDIDRSRAASLAFHTYDKVHDKCLIALERAKIFVVGECVSTGCDSGCCKRSVSAGSAAKASDKGGIGLRCGTFKVIGVNSVTTEGNKATVKFTREFVADNEVLASLGDCALQMPEKGRAEKSWDYVRDDDGNWSRTSK